MLSDPSHKVIITNQVESKYRYLLVKHGTLEQDLHKSHKKYRKKLIEENLQNVTSQKSPRANEPDHLRSNEAGVHDLDVAIVRQLPLVKFFNQRSSF